MAIDLIGTVLGLIVDALYSWGRMLVALFLSIIIGIAIGIYAAVSGWAEKVILPLVDILQTLPILAFFPFAIYIFVAVLPGYIGINAAVIFLIVTSMLWNIIFGVYEAVKVIPTETMELGELYRMGTWEKLRKIYIPACLPNIAEQSILSWAVGLFYLVTSEIFSTGNAQYQVTHGIGVALVAFAAAGNTTAYLCGIAVFIIFVIVTRFALFSPFEAYANRYKFQRQEHLHRTPHVGLLERRFLRYVKSEERLFGGLIRTSKEKAQLKPSPIRKDERRVEIVVAAAIMAGLLLMWALGLLNSEAQVLTALVFSFARVWFAFVVGSLIAIPVCVYLTFFAKRDTNYLTLFQILAAIPATILLPEIVVLFRNAPGGAELVAFSIFLLSGIWYMIFSIMGTARSLPPELFEVKKLFGVEGKAAWKKIFLIALLPGMITGAITAIAAEWNASIVAEYFMNTQGAVATQVGTGIGKLLDVSLTASNLWLMGLALLNLVAMIIIINTFVWKRLYRRVSDVYK